MVHNLASKFFELGRRTKWAIQVGFDIFALLASYWLATALRRDGIDTSMNFDMWLPLLIVLPVTIAAFTALGLYQAIVRYFASEAVRSILIGVSVSAIFLSILGNTFFDDIPRTVPIIYFLFFLNAVLGSRFLMRGMFMMIRENSRQLLLVYGDAKAAMEYISALSRSAKYKCALFVDVRGQYSGRKIHGVPVINPINLHTLTQKIKFDLALVCCQDGPDRKAAIAHLNELGLKINIIDQFASIISGQPIYEKMKQVNIDDLLGRDQIAPISRLMTHTTSSKVVMVTGAAGSIGRELALQVLTQKPQKFLAVDHSEIGLYELKTYLTENLGVDIVNQTVEFVLGSVLNKDLMEKIIRTCAVNTIYHAAAYKHVPIIEENEIIGIQNNFLGTEIVCEIAGLYKVAHLTLVSTDKAVRPSNVMGASKRLAELVVLEKSRAFPDTNYCIVRFGNVLGSSGSVVPKFNAQIQSGGPITVTHQDVTRYFMTIKEASQLVIQASALSDSGKTYVLDMGKPVKIIDLARNMANLQGLRTNLDLTSGPPASSSKSIEIQITGLRPGEKLHEELFISTSISGTQHPRIFQENLDPKTLDGLIKMLSEIRLQLLTAIESDSAGHVRKILSQLVELDHYAS